MFSRTQGSFSSHTFVNFGLTVTSASLALCSTAVHLSQPPQDELHKKKIIEHFRYALWSSLLTIPVCEEQAYRLSIPSACCIQRGGAEGGRVGGWWVHLGNPDPYTEPAFPSTTRSRQQPWWGQQVHRDLLPYQL